MLGVLADDHYLALALDNLALVAHRFYRRSYFHCNLPFLNYLALHVILPFVRS